MDSDDSTSSSDINENEIKCGIRNPSNYCFLNASLQCLASSSFIIEYFLNNNDADIAVGNVIIKYDLNNKTSDELEQKCNEILENDNTLPKNTIKCLKKIIKKKNLIHMYFSVRKFIMELYKNRSMTMDPSKLISCCKLTADKSGFDHLFTGEQNDPHEFLAFLLDKLHEYQSTTVNITIPENIDNYTIVNQLYFKTYKKRFENDHSYFVNNLYFYVLNLVLCSQCGYKSYEISTSDILCVSIPINNSEESITINDCIDNLFSMEDIDYKCEKCGNKEGNKLDKKILTRPPVLIIKLKRYTNIGQSLVKINRLVEYNLHLDVSNVCCNNKECKYELNGVINHIGTLNSGHYYSYVKNMFPGKTNEIIIGDNWFICNDEKITEIDEDDVLNSKNAYILFYQSV